MISADTGTEVGLRTCRPLSIYTVCHACALILNRVAIVFTKRDQLLGYRGQSVGIRREMETVSEGSGTYTVKNNATTLYMSVFQHFLLKNVFSLILLGKVYCDQRWYQFDGSIWWRKGDSLGETVRTVLLSPFLCTIMNYPLLNINSK